jgi:nitrite reductase (NADH) small subunit
MSLQAIQQPKEPSDGLHWSDVCSVDDIDPGTGVAALVAGDQIALVKTRAGRIYAISNFDPFSKAFVMSRGIIGSKGEIQKIASPIYKQCFDLQSGQCLDDPSVRLPVYPVRIVGERVRVGTRVSPVSLVNHANDNGGTR